jgi:hypothetical protein
MSTTFNNTVNNSMVDVNNHLNIIDMKENEVVASQNAKVSVKNEVSNKVIIMNEKIDFSRVCGEEAVATTPTIDQVVVNEMFKAFLAMPTSVTVKFKNFRGVLKINVQMYNGSRKFVNNFETNADFKLVEKVMGAMYNEKNIEALNDFNVEEHPLVASETDPRIELFKQMLYSSFRCRFEPDLVVDNGDRYVCASFIIRTNKEFKFYLPRTEEIEEIINNAIQAA